MFNSKTVLAATCFICVVWQAIGKADADGEFMQHLIDTITQSKVDKCMEEVGLTKEELMRKKADHENEPSEKELCLLKCFGLASGAFNTDGTLNMDKAKTNVMPKFQNPEVFSCLKKIGTISTCEDMKKMLNCFPKNLQA